MMHTMWQAKNRGSYYDCPSFILQNPLAVDIVNAVGKKEGAEG